MYTDLGQGPTCLQSTTRARLISITGTNGKTTTSLAYDIIERHIEKALLVGNIGDSLPDTRSRATATA